MRFWEGLVLNYKGAQVIDLSLSVPLASACLRRGIKYLGVAMNAEHGQWAQNCLDREAVRAIVDSSHPLHQGSLAESLKKHFGDLVEMADPSDDSENVAPATPPP